ncbi:MAG: Smr/MutS family protein [Candidatus Eutrophobiaceae bacterium]
MKKTPPSSFAELLNQQGYGHPQKDEPPQERPNKRSHPPRPNCVQKVPHTPALASTTDLLFKRDGLQDKVFRRLKKGDIPIVAELDLHGYTYPEASDKVNVFINRRHNAERSAVLIIYGKGLRSAEGKSVLRGQVLEMLRKDTRVLAYCPDGNNTGAARVLLRKV